MMDRPLPGGGIVTMPDALGQYVMVNGKRVYFDFDKRFGPLVLDANGEPRKQQPGERNPFWQPFKIWLDQWWSLRPYVYWCAVADNRSLHHWREQPGGYESRCGKRSYSLKWRGPEKQKCVACEALAAEQSLNSPAEKV
jgi:hypothetical protein